jgi:pteridine reductase
LKTTQVALITGAARRIGECIATRLHAEGFAVVLHYHQVSSASLCERLNAKRPHSAVAIQADLQDLHAIKLLVGKSIQEWDRLDVMVHNASTFFPTPVEKSTEIEWNNLMGVNAKAFFFLAKEAAAALRKSKGSIVGIGDIHGERPLKNYALYSTAKAALLMLGKALAKELAPVRVNTVSPGAILWPEEENKLDEATKAAIIDRTLLKCQGDPLAVANAVNYLVSEAEYVTGSNLIVDGGSQWR